jgi:hypothetical protein
MSAIVGTLVAFVGTCEVTPAAPVPEGAADTRCTFL